MKLLAHFYYITALILGQNCVNGLRVTKIVKEIKLKVAWCELEAKKMFSKTIIHKIFETKSSFHVK